MRFREGFAITRVPVVCAEKRAQLERIVADFIPVQCKEGAALVDRLDQWNQSTWCQRQSEWMVDLFKQRSSVRHYQERTIPAAMIQLLQLAAVHAATSRNQQARRFAFIQATHLREALVESGGMQTFVAQAPLVIAGIATSRTGLGTVADVLISLSQIEVTALSAGLATCWLGMFDEAAVHRLLRLPAAWRVAMMMSVGYHAKATEPQAKRATHEIVWYDEFSATHGATDNEINLCSPSATGEQDQR